jgi:hypothetical protein
VGQKPGYPRFRSGDRYNSFSLSAPAFRMEGPDVLILPSWAAFVCACIGRCAALPAI